MKKARLAGLVVECFRNRIKPEYRCSNNGPPVSAFEYAICRVEQSSGIGESGSTVQDQRSEQLSKAAGANVSSVLEAMLDDIQPTPRGTVNEVIAAWGAQLSGFNHPGLNISDFVAQNLRDCFDRARRPVDGEVMNPSIELGRAAVEPRRLRELDPQNPEIFERIRQFEG